ESYNKTLEIIQEAENYIEAKVDEKELFGGKKYETLSKNERENLLAQILPVIRGEVSENEKMIVNYDDSDSIQTFVNSNNAKELSQIGAACPDHLVHTKRSPLYVEWNPDDKEDVDKLITAIKEGISAFKEEYTNYFKRNKSSGDKMFEAIPRVILIPGIGMVNTGKSYSAAYVSKSLYHRAIAVMRGSTTLGNFVSLNEEESFAIEYWPLELYKLSLAPPEAEFSRQVALITGAAGGIGSATSYRLAEEGAHVVLADIDIEGAKHIAEKINELYGDHRALAVKIDVTKEEKVKKAINQTVLTYGGLDIIVNNAGLASSSPLEDTTLENWNLNIDVLVTGYFLVAREAFKLLKQQEIGGNMVFVGSKNS